MNSMAPDLSALDPFFDAFIGIAVLGAVISLVIIGQALASFAPTNHRAGVALSEAVPSYLPPATPSH